MNEYFSTASKYKMLCEVWKEPSVRFFPKIRTKKQGRGFKAPDICSFRKLYC